jgi:hypothetical protein
MMTIYQFEDKGSLWLCNHGHFPPDHPKPGGGYILRALRPLAETSLAAIALNPRKALEEVIDRQWWVLSEADLRPGWRDALGAKQCPQ